MKKLAIAVPTYNRCEDIDLFIKSTSFTADLCDVDLLIYDSSEDEKTKDVVDAHNRDRKVSPVIHCKVSSDIPSNEKLYNIYAELCDRYEYIWIIHDHTVFGAEAFDFIYKNLDKKADFFYLKMHCPAGLKTCRIRQEEDRELFLYDSAWFLGKIGAAIVKSTTFLEGIDWPRYREKYLSPELINFSHIGLYFERLAEMKAPKMFVMEFPRNCFNDTYAFKKLGWNDDMVRICTRCWGGVIESLPKTYRNKAKVMTTIDRHLITKYKLLELKESGLYGWGSYVRYREWIKKTFPDMNRKAFAIAILPLSVAKRIFLGGMMRAVKQARKKGIPVYIYGAGRHGYECLDVLLRNGMDTDGFVVTNMKGNPDNISGYTVKTVEEVLSANEGVLFILALMEIYIGEVVAFIADKNADGAQISHICY